MTEHSFDASSFIWLGRRYCPLYPMDVFPSVWAAMARSIRRGALFICREAFDEVTGDEQDDELAQWLRKMAGKHAGFVRDHDAVSAMKSLEIARRFPGLMDDEWGAEGADIHIVAHAAVVQATVVTQEIPARKQPGSDALDEDLRKIPDVCGRLGVDCVDLSEFMRRQGMRF